MREDLGPKGRFKAGQDFRAQRERARSRSLLKGTPRSSDTIHGGTPPTHGKAVRDIGGSIQSERISERAVGNQDKYGAERETARRIVREWGKQNVKSRR